MTFWLSIIWMWAVCYKTAGATPTIVSYIASAVIIYSATSSLVRFEIQIFSSCLKNRYYVNDTNPNVPNAKVPNNKVPNFDKTTMCRNVTMSML
jgi:hypothetical protein